MSEPSEKEEKKKEEAEAKPERVEVPAAKEEEEEEILEERLYTIPLRITHYVPRWKRTPRASRFVREFVARHMKMDNILIMPEVNEVLWQKGISKPPKRIRVRVVKTADEIVKVYNAPESAA